MRTVLLIWGSADWPSLHPHIDAGAMPHLQRLIERGTIATLASAEPLTREILLTSIATGLLGDRHGVLGPTQIRADGGGVEATGRRSWQAPAFWELLAAVGVRTACVNWAATAPADRWPGLHVDDSFATPSGRDFETWAVPPHSVSPAAMAEQLAALRVHPADELGSEIAAFVPRAHTVEQAADRRLAALGGMLARAATVHAVATQIAATAEWEVLCVYQEFLRVTKVGFLREAAGSVYGGVLSQAHRLLDMMLGRIVELAGDGATIVLVSPNGLSATPDGSIQVHPRGILVAAGPGIAADTMLSGARTVDIAPTILARYGLSTPSDGGALAALVPVGQVLRPAPEPAPAAELAELDPADELLAQGYGDKLTPAQHQAMLDADNTRLFHLGVARMSRGDLAGAAQVLQAAQQRRPEDPGILRRLARCHALMGDYAACKPLGEALLAIDPYQPWGHLAMATWCAFASPVVDAEPYLVSARELGANKRELLIQIGGLELRRNRPDRAALDFEAALALDPVSAEAAYGVGLARYRLGEFVAAETALRWAIELEHNQPLAHLQLGTLLAAQGRLREAVAALETALGQSPGQDEIKVLLERTQGALAQELAAGAIDAETRGRS